MKFISPQDVDSVAKLSDKQIEEFLRATEKLAGVLATTKTRGPPAED
jgi:hypothetical protein